MTESFQLWAPEFLKSNTLKEVYTDNRHDQKISRVTSQGMLYDIGYTDGIKPALAMPERPIPNGSRLG